MNKSQYTCIPFHLTPYLYGANPMWINRIGIKWLFRLEKRYAPPQNIFLTASSKTRYLSPGAREPVRTERTNISKILAGGMPLLVRKPKIYVYNTSLRHLEHSMERIGSDTRAYHSLTSHFCILGCTQCAMRDSRANLCCMSDLRRPGQLHEDAPDIIASRSGSRYILGTTTA